jgi:general secretion pathway protein J
MLSDWDQLLRSASNSSRKRQACVDILFRIGLLKIAVLSFYRMATKNSGFTLIEVMLALALSALLLTTVYWTYFSINRSIDAATEGHEAMETGRSLIELLKRDIRGITPERYTLVATNEEIDGQKAGTINFTTTAHLGPETHQLTRVGYALVQDPDGKKILIRKQTRNLRDEVAEYEMTSELSRIVDTFSLDFYDGTDWVDNWDSKARGALPKQVRITLDVSDRRGKTKTFTTEENIPGAL